MTGTYDQWLILEIWTPFLKAPMGPSLHQGSNLTLLVTSTKQRQDPSSGRCFVDVTNRVKLDP